MDVQELCGRINGISRFPLAHRPTPLEPLDRLSRELGGPRLWIKRDDCTGLAFGGNKARHNEFLLAEALRREADLLVWCGGVQSNNCRQTAAACAKAGLDCHLVLTRPSSADGEEIAQGNFLLDQLIGASYELVDSRFGAPLERKVAEVAARFEAMGRRVFHWDRDVVTPLAAISYVECLAEIAEQATAAGFSPDAVYVSSSGSTGAGLTLGARALHLECPVKNFAYVHWDWDSWADMAHIANRAAALLGLSVELKPREIDLSFDYIAPGYGKLSEPALEAISLLARTEAIFLDPVYTSKAMAALLQDVRGDRYRQTQNVVFVHTGGTPALFAFANELARSRQQPSGSC